MRAVAGGAASEVTCATVGVRPAGKQQSGGCCDSAVTRDSSGADRTRMVDEL